MPAVDLSKLRAASAAASLVADGMNVGLGSGTTAALVIKALGDRVAQERLRFTGFATSDATATLARSLNIPLRDLDEVALLDLDIDGADEVDPQFRMIKGRGGALLREKIVAAASSRCVIVIGPDKRVDRLGSKYPVPVEVSPFGIKHTEHGLRALGAETAVRQAADGSVLVTDGGHQIIDCRFGVIDDPYALDHRLRQVIGVLETGLFLDLCDLLVVGHATSAELLERPAL